MTVRVRRLACGWAMLAIGLFTFFAMVLFLGDHMWAEANAYATLAAFAITAVALTLERSSPAYPPVTNAKYPQVSDMPPQTATKESDHA